MEMINDTQRVLGIINDMVQFSHVQRFEYPLDIHTAMAIVMRIGKMRASKFVVDKDNEFVYENIVRWAHGNADMLAHNPNNAKQVVKGDLNKGLYIAGNTGTGKTWATEIMGAYLSVYDFDVDMTGYDKNFIPLCWETYRSDVINADFVSSGTIRCKDVPILCIQDLGVEPEYAMYMGNKVNVLKELIEYRGDKKDKLTFFTSNIPMGHALLEKRYGSRVVSRLREMCNYLELRGQDRRNAL